MKDKITLSTGHKELDDILDKNNILDQEEQNRIAKQRIEDLRARYNKETAIECLHDQFDRSYIERGMKPPAIRCISCPCPRCSPTYMSMISINYKK